MYFRLSTLENSKENEYLAKISSLEQKISNLLKVQQQLENTIEHLKRDSNEDDLKLQIENLERSERALLRKIEILQQSENRSHSAQVNACSNICYYSFCYLLDSGWA